MRVLVADDDPTGATILARTLGRWGLEAVVAHDGEDAWRIIDQDGGIAMAILDWMMPGADGLELCRRIRREERHAHMHVILLTARDGRADVVAGLDAGADDYLIKPFDTEELRARVHVGIRVLALQERLADRVAELQVALSSVKQLSGLLPICSYCKRIRSDENYWERVESYIGEHTDAKFTHGICPQCYETFLKQLGAAHGDPHLQTPRG
jgi:sigma-B regulation protein RsbU (phosphoserine phosphatase)